MGVGPGGAEGARSAHQAAAASTRRAPSPVCTRTAPEAGPLPRSDGARCARGPRSGPAAGLPRHPSPPVKPAGSPGTCRGRAGGWGSGPRGPGGQRRRRRQGRVMPVAPPAPACPRRLTSSLGGFSLSFTKQTPLLHCQVVYGHAGDCPAPAEEAGRCRSHRGLAGRPEVTATKATFRGAGGPARAARPVGWLGGPSRGVEAPVAPGRERSAGTGGRPPMRDGDELPARPAGTASGPRRRVMAHEGASFKHSGSRLGRQRPLRCR